MTIVQDYLAAQAKISEYKKLFSDIVVSAHQIVQSECSTVFERKSYTIKQIAKDGASNVCVLEDDNDKIWISVDSNDAFDEDGNLELTIKSNLVDAFLYNKDAFKAAILSQFEDEIKAARELEKIREERHQESLKRKKKEELADLILKIQKYEKEYGVLVCHGLEELGSLIEEENSDT
jgi:hypothetical protein